MQKEFEKAFPVINGMARTLRLFNESLFPKSVMELWQEFVKTREMEFPHVCDFVRIMLATPPNSAWVERAYSKQEQPARCDATKLMLIIPIKECMDYEKEISILTKI